MERIGFVFALSMTALPVCGLATGVAGIVLALPFLFPKGCLASLVVHLVIYGFYRVARLRILPSRKEASDGAGMVVCRVSGREGSIWGYISPYPVRDSHVGLYRPYAGTASGLMLQGGSMTAIHLVLRKAGA
ncbi:hypothetical protein [uncultured Desulfovibrio sp.]|uniref:hypothetical protein n=1 Tax=uncultured Desulfovibrio sp. TaxID=167968 RepID=UPI002601BEA5|nr:hypothetical protein [uncultured Desulfovibrio sp.]